MGLFLIDSILKGLDEHITELKRLNPDDEELERRFPTIKNLQAKQRALEQETGGKWVLVETPETPPLPLTLEARLCDTWPRFVCQESSGYDEVWDGELVCGRRFLTDVGLGLHKQLRHGMGDDEEWSLRGEGEVGRHGLEFEE